MRKYLFIFVIFPSLSFSYVQGNLNQPLCYIPNVVSKDVSLASEITDQKEGLEEALKAIEVNIKALKKGKKISHDGETYDYEDQGIKDAKRALRNSLENEKIFGGAVSGIDNFVVDEIGKSLLSGINDDDEGFDWGKESNACKTVTSNSGRGDDKKHCVTWQNNSGQDYFEDSGEMEDAETFCGTYLVEGKEEECTEALDLLKDGLEELVELEKDEQEITDQLAELRKEERELKREERQKRIARLRGEEDEDEDTEAHSICLSGRCMSVAAYRELSKPTTGQTVGNVLSILSGVGLGYLGIREGQKARRETNKLRALQGFEAQGNDIGYTLASLSLAYPFLSKGIYGLTKGTNPNFSCGGSVNHHNGIQIPGGHHTGLDLQNYHQYGPNGLNLNNYHQYGPNGLNLQSYQQYDPSLQLLLNNGHPGTSVFNPYAQSGFPGGGDPSLQLLLNNGIHSGGDPRLQLLLNGGLHSGGDPRLQLLLNGGLNSGLHGRTPVFNPHAQAYQAQLAQQQYHAQLAQQQLEVKLEAQKIWFEKQQSVHAERNRRRQVISGLTHELYKIQQQINLVATTGVGDSSILGASTTSISAGLTIGSGSNLSGNTTRSTSPTHSPAPTTPNTNTGEIPVLITR